MDNSILYSTEKCKFTRSNKSVTLSMKEYISRNIWGSLCVDNENLLDEELYDMDDDIGKAIRNR